MTTPALHVRRLAASASASETPTLLLVHGVTDDGGCWPDAVPRWPGHDIVAVDLRGHGHSPRFDPADLDRPVERLGADLDEVVRDLAATGPVVGIGHSMGAGALVVAALDGAPLDGLVLEDARVAHPRSRVRERLGRMRARELRAWQEAPDDALAALRAGEPTWSDAELRACARARPLGDAAFLATGRTGLDGDDALSVRLVRDVARRVPTLLLTGEGPGTIWNPGMIEGLEGSRVRSVVVAGAGHCVRREQPGAYHAAVDHFLAGLDPAGGPGRPPLSALRAASAPRRSR